MSGPSTTKTEEVLPVGPYVVPAEELYWRFSPSGGPGGQHANRSNTRAELTFEVLSSRAFPESIRKRLVTKVGSTVTVVAADTRSQWRNRQLARERLATRLEEALIRRKPRRPTKPTRGSVKTRLDEKKRQGAKKRLRRIDED
ncbi:MAG TPA: alternative ribosome rescue aminoacyl-tRNA hydrolase ArfB [Acidimicrobiia bacterium]|nr:alternative ribosome rescue aminoacyl-tRNA hydrolase ArfB [Acidimicrobiia bacterium]